MENSKENNVNLKKAFNNFLESITQYNKDIQSGFGFDNSPSGVAEAEKATEKAKNIIASFAAGPAYFAMNIYRMQYEQEFKFVTDPALRSIAGSMPGYYQILGNALADRERLSQQYRMMGLNSIINLSGTAVNLGIQASLRTTAGKSLVAQFASRTGARNLAAGAAGAAARAGAARAIGVFLGPIGIALSTVFLLFEIFQVIQNFARNKDLIKNAENRSLMALFNPKPLMALYEKNAFLLGSPKPDNMGGMELLTGTAWEDELAEGKIPSTINSWSGSVYNSAFNADFSDILTGADIRGFGFDNQKVLAAVGNMSRNVHTGANEDVVAQILMMSGLYTGGDTSLMESISQNIVKSSGFTSQDVRQATERFEEFFAAVVGDGRPQASYLNLVEALSSFAYSYAMGTRANLDSSGAIAEIQQFMGDNGMINGRFDVKATQTAITSIDEFLLQGATYQDLGAAQMLQSMDISREDAIRGVTYDSKTFEKFLDGLMDYLKVTNDDVLNNTRRFDVSLQNFAMMTNISNEQLNAIMVALRRRASGYSVESVRTEYLENFADDVNNKLAPYENFSDSYLNVMEIMSNITYSNNKYLEAIRLNLDTVQLFNQIILDISEQGFSGSFARILQSLQEMVGISQEVITPTQRALMQQANILQGTGVTPPAPGTVDAARNQINVARQVNINADAGFGEGILDVEQFLSSLPDFEASFYYELINATEEGYGLHLPPDQDFQDFINQARLDYPEIVEFYFPNEETRSEQQENQIQNEQIIEEEEEEVREQQDNAQEQSQQGQEQQEQNQQQQQQQQQQQRQEQRQQQQQQRQEQRQQQQQEQQDESQSASDQLNKIEDALRNYYSITLFESKLPIAIELIELHEAQEYTNLFSFREKEDPNDPFYGTDITEMTLSEVMEFTEAGGAYHELNLSEGHDTTAVGKYQFLGSTLRDIIDRSNGEFNLNAKFDADMQNRLFIWYLKDTIRVARGDEEEARRRLMLRWEGFKKAYERGQITDENLNDIINEINSYAVGGFVFQPKNSSSSISMEKPAFKNMHISIPLQSKNPTMSAARFSELMSKYLS